jgi:hypothetical protein
MRPSQPRTAPRRAQPSHPHLADPDRRAGHDRAGSPPIQTWPEAESRTASTIKAKTGFNSLKSNPLLPHPARSETEVTTMTATRPYPYTLVFPPGHYQADGSGSATPLWVD